MGLFFLWFLITNFLCPLKQSQKHVSATSGTNMEEKKFPKVFLWVTSKLFFPQQQFQFLEQSKKLICLRTCHQDSCSVRQNQVLVTFGFVCNLDQESVCFLESIPLRKSWYQLHSGKTYAWWTWGHGFEHCWSLGFFLPIFFLFVFEQQR